MVMCSCPNWEKNAPDVSILLAVGNFKLKEVFATDASTEDSELPEIMYSAEVGVFGIHTRTRVIFLLNVASTDAS